jgi:hypothetical protein
LTSAVTVLQSEPDLYPHGPDLQRYALDDASGKSSELAARMRACERIVAESPDRAERRAAAVEISQILRQAETISA